MCRTSLLSWSWLYTGTWQRIISSSSSSSLSSSISLTSSSSPTTKQRVRQQQPQQYHHRYQYSETSYSEHHGYTNTFLCKHNVRVHNVRIFYCMKTDMWTPLMWTLYQVPIPKVLTFQRFHCIIHIAKYMLSPYVTISCWSVQLLSLKYLIYGENIAKKIVFRSLTIFAHNMLLVIMHTLLKSI